MRITKSAARKVLSVVDAGLSCGLGRPVPDMVHEDSDHVSARWFAAAAHEFTRRDVVMKGFFYLATPYTKYPGGIEAAFEMACRAAAQFIRARIPIHSPIAHTHPVAKYGNIDPLDHSIWLPADQPMMDCACGLIVWKAISWDESYGVQMEIEEFARQGKPIFYLDPDDFPIEHFVAFAKERGWEF